MEDTMTEPLAASEPHSEPARPEVEPTELVTGSTRSQRAEAPPADDAPVERQGPLFELLDLVGGRWPLEALSSVDKVRMALRAGGAALGLAALYGVVIGSTDLQLALGNAWKLPGVLALSSLTALPAGLLAHRLTGGRRGSSSLFASTAAGNFAAALVLAALAPLVALYYHTTAMLGAPLAMGTGMLALVVGIGSGARLMWRARDGKMQIFLPTAVLLVVQLLAMLQFLHLASPILPEATVFEAGIEGALK